MERIPLIILGASCAGLAVAISMQFQPVTTGNRLPRHNFDSGDRVFGPLTHSPLAADKDEITLESAGTIEVLFTASLEAA